MKKNIQKYLLSLFVIVFAMIMFTGCSFSIFNIGNQGTTYTEPTSIDTTKTLDERVQQIAKDYVSAVVTIYEVNTEGTEIAFGSGVGIYQGGYIATNYHVIADVVENTGYTLQVYFNDTDTAYDATILWYQMNFDVAILKCSNENLPFVEMSDRFINAGENSLNALETVVAIGTPLDFSLQNTVTLGYISSAKSRVSYSDGNVYENLIQHTAPINHGNSGGALFDSYGKLIGLNALGNDDANSIFFAVPIYPVMLVIDDVVSAHEQNKTYSTPKIGVSAYDAYQASYADVDFSDDGMLVTQITENGPATGKLQVNDILKSIKVNNTTYQITLRNDLLFALLNAKTGDTVTVTYVRGLFTNTVDIILA